MPAARGVKRAASKASAATTSSAPKNKKKRGVIQLEVPQAPKRRGRVLTCGQGDVGQLGLGQDVEETSKFMFVTALGDKIIDVYAGGMHTIALDSNGKVWTFGCNDEGALGRTTTDDSEEVVPKAVSLPAKAVSISGGDSHSAALLHNGDVYVWGAFRDSHGSMGLVVHGREGKPSKTPVKLELGEPGVALASGGDHLVVLSTSGAVYTLGCGEQGQLGRLSQRSASRDARQGLGALLVPSKVTLKAGASRIWAGYHATFVLDASAEKMFAWGLNNYGQLGITGEKRKTALYTPAECDAFTSLARTWTAVAPGQHHSLALDEAGVVHAIGRCEYGRLGLGDRAGDAEVLEPVPTLQNKKCISIAAGTSNSFAVTNDGTILSWGMGTEGALGTGQCEDCTTPTPALTPALDSRRPTHVSAGGQHTVLLVEDTKPQREDSPPPETETAEEKMEEDSQESQEEEEVKQPRGRGKRQRMEQEEEISSTSVVASETPVGDKPEKVNGDKKKETPMEVDDTEDSQEADQKPESKTIPEEKVTDKVETETEDQSEPENTKPETTDTSSQETVDSETKSDITEVSKVPEVQETSQNEQKDVEIPEEKPEINGITESDAVGTETKTLVVSSNPITTTA